MDIRGMTNEKLPEGYRGWVRGYDSRGEKCQFFVTAVVGCFYTINDDPHKVIVFVRPELV